MNPEKIGPLYEGLSKHFEVPMIEWKIFPKRLTRTVSTKKPLPYLEIKSKIVTDFRGRFILEPSPKIVFYGVPTLEIVMHEFMHYLVCYTKKNE